MAKRYTNRQYDMYNGLWYLSQLLFNLQLIKYHIFNPNDLSRDIMLDVQRISHKMWCKRNGK